MRIKNSHHTIRSQTQKRLDHHVVQLTEVDSLVYDPGRSVKGWKAGLTAAHFMLFWLCTKLPLNRRKPENNSLLR